MSFTVEMDIGKGVQAIDIYNFIRAKQNDIGGALLINIALPSRLIKELGPPTQLMTVLVVSLHVPLCQRVRIISNRFVIM